MINQKPNKNIYADYCASAPLKKEVVSYLQDRLTQGPFANPNSLHALGQQVMGGIERSREIVAKSLGARPFQVIFNSCSTEGITQVFHSFMCKKNSKNKVIISSIEHPAVSESAKFYAQFGFDILEVKVGRNGQLNLNDLEQVLKSHQAELALVAIMAANNETGIIQPMEQIGFLCQKYQVPFLCDTTQYIGKLPFDFEKLPIDYAVCSGHKVGAFTGTGCLLSKNPSTLKPLLHGGGQEGELRSGTQNYLGNETLAIALQAVQKELAEVKYKEVESLRNNFEKFIKEKHPQVVIIGENSPRLPNISLISYPGIHSQAVQIELESQNIFVTTSAACSDNEPSTSKVLKEMGIEDNVGRGVIRVSFGTTGQKQDYDQLASALIKIYEKLSKIKSY